MKIQDRRIIYILIVLIVGGSLVATTRTSASGGIGPQGRRIEAASGRFEGPGTAARNTAATDDLKSAFAVKTPPGLRLLPGDAAIAPTAGDRTLADDNDGDGTLIQ